MRDLLRKWKVECRADDLVPMPLAIFPVHVSKVLRRPRKGDARSYEVLHPLRNQRPDLLTSLLNMSFVLVLPRKMHLFRSSSNVPRLSTLFKLLQSLHFLLTFDKVQNPLRRPRETTSERPKVVRTCGAFSILTWKCASRHNGIHFFNISTCKSAPNLCALRILTSKCASATTVCTFSSSQLPEVV